MRYLPSSANPFGTVSNRWSFAKSPKNKGTNTSTIPKVMRLMIDAPPGRIFISPDLPQAEARIVAWDALCMSMIKVLSDPTRHIHLENCNRLFGHKLVWGTHEAEEYKKTDEYTQGKAMLHAANYRMSAKRLAVELGCGVGRAKELLAAYFQLYPEVVQWQNTILDRIRTSGCLESPSPFSRRRLFYSAVAERLNTGKISNETWNSACSWIPQSAIADIVNWGLRRLKDEFGDTVWIHKHDHDSYLASVPVASQHQIVPVSLSGLQIPLQIHSRWLTMVPDMSIGYNYGLMVGWTGQPLSRNEWWEKVRGKLDPEKLRKELYGYV